MAVVVVVMVVVVVAVVVMVVVVVVVVVIASIIGICAGSAVLSVTRCNLVQYQQQPGKPVPER